MFEEVNMNKIRKITAVLTAILFIANTASFADILYGIKTDDRTETKVQHEGNTYNISTETVLGNTGFN